MNGRRLFWLAFFPLFTVFGGPETANAKPIHFGFNDDTLPLVANIATQQELGADVARTPLAGDVVDCEPNLKCWGVSDEVYSTHLAAGITPLFTIYGSPTWATKANGTPNLGWLRGFYRRVAARYPRAILQVLNEPNQPAFGSMTPDQVASIVRAAEKSIHSVNPHQTVIGPPPSPGMPGWQEYLRRVYRRLVGVDIDPSLHLYAWGQDPVRYLLKQYKRLDRATKHPIWVTETGVSAGMYPGKRQGQVSRRLRRALRRVGAQGVIFHRLAEDPDGGDWERRARLWAIDQQGQMTILGRALRRN